RCGAGDGRQGKRNGRWQSDGSGRGHATGGAARAAGDRSGVAGECVYVTSGAAADPGIGAGERAVDDGVGSGVYVTVGTEIPHVSLHDRRAARESESAGVVAIDLSATVKGDRTASAAGGETRIVKAGHDVGFEKGRNFDFGIANTGNIAVRGELPKLGGQGQV